MADKFQVVKNAQDGSPKSMLSVVNNQMAINGDLIASGQITAAKLATNTVTAEKIATNAITSAKIAADAIESNKIKAGAVVAGKLATNSVAANNLAANAVTAEKIAAGAITAQKMSANSVGTNALQAGAVVAGKLAANSVDAGNIKAGAINANHISAGQISADKLAIGLGGNLLYNPIFANPTNGVPDGWAHHYQFLPDNKYGARECYQDPDWGLKGAYLPTENVIKWHINRTGNPSTRVGLFQNVKISANTWYMLSAYLGNHRCTNVQIYLDQRGRNGEYYSLHTYDLTQQVGFSGLTDAHRGFCKFKSHPNTVSLDVWFFMYDRVAGNVSQDTAFMFVARPMLEECTEHTREPSPWQNAGVTAIHGGSIVSETITAQQIAADAITSNKIVAGAITGDKIAANTITGSLIAAGQEIRAPTIRGGILEVGSLIGGNLYEFSALSPNGYAGNTITIAPSIAQRILKISWDTNTVHYNGGGTALGQNGDWITRITTTMPISQFYRRGLYVQIIPANTEVKITLQYFANNIVNPIDIETTVFSGSQYISVN